MLKKILSLTLVTIMLVFQLAAVPARAAVTGHDTGAIDNALTQLAGLKSAENKKAVAVILGYVLAAIKEHEAQSKPLTAEDLYDIAETQYKTSTINQTVKWDDIIGSTSGKIEKASVVVLLNQVVARESVLKDYYDTANGLYQQYIITSNPSNSLDFTIKDRLGLDHNAPRAAVYAMLLSNIGQVISYNSTNGFYRYGDDNTAIINILTAIQLSDLATFVTADQKAKINDLITKTLTKVNEYISTYSLTTSNIDNIKSFLEAF